MSATAPTSTPLSPEDAADVSVLESTLFRFASCEDDKLEANVSRVLPKLLPLFLRPSTPIRDALMLICNHVNKRMKAIPNMRLPVAELLQLYVQHANEVANPNTGFFITFTLMYVEKGFARLTVEERCALAHELLPGISLRTPPQQKQLLHTFFRSLHPSDYHMDKLAPEEHERRWKPIRESPKDQEVLLEFMLDVLLWAPVYVPPTPKIPGLPQPLPTAASASSAATPVAAPEPPMVPDGLSAGALATLTLDHTLPSSAVQLLKSACLHFLTSDIFSQNQMLPLAIAGSSVGTSDVVHAGESLLKRLKNIELEETKLIQKLFDMYLGSMETPNIPQDQRRKPVNYNMKLKILNYLSRSKVSVTMMQPALKVIMDTFFSPASTAKLKNVGLMYLGWFINNQPNQQHLYSIAPVLLNALLKFLGTCRSTATAPVEEAADGARDEKERQTSSSIILAQLRGETYQLIGQLSLKRPDLFNKNLKMLGLFFKALQEESNDSTLQNIHEGLSMLRSSYVGVDSTVQNELQFILLTMFTQPDRRVRLNALQCLNRLFPFQDILARYLCLMMDNDPALEIRDEAQRGLIPFIPKNELEAQREQQKRKREQERAKEEEAEAKRKREREEGKEVEESSTTVAMEDVEESKSAEPVALAIAAASAAATSPSSSTTSPQPNALLSLLRPIEAALVPYPSFSALVAFAHAHILAPQPPAANGSPQAQQLIYLKAEVTFEIRALPRLLDFIAETLKQNAFYATEGSGKDKNSMDTSSDASSNLTPAKTASGLTDEEIQKLMRKFAEDLLATEAAAGIPVEERSLIKFQSLIEYALEQRVHDVQANAAQHLVKLVSLAPTIFAPVYANRLSWIENNMLSGIQLLRTAMADLLNLISSSLEPTSVVLDLLNRFLTAMNSVEKVIGPSRDDATHGCILALGVLTAEALKRNQAAGFVVDDSTLDSSTAPFPLPLLRTILLKIAEKLDGATFTRTPYITAAAIISIGRIGQVSRLPIPIKSSEASADSSSSAAKSTDTSIVAPTNRTKVVETLFIMIRSSGERKGERIQEESIKSLSLLCTGDTSIELLNQVVDGFFGVANTKHEELHFAIGEALSVIAKQHQFPLPTTTTPISLSLASPTSPMDTSDSSASSSSSTTTSTNITIPPNQDLLYSILPRLFKLIAGGSSLQRTAACTWLLCLVKFSWSLPAIEFFFEKIQASFSVALTDSNQFIQEVAAKGMSILYEHASGTIQQELITSLLKTFSSGQRKVTNDTVITIDEEKGEFSTYKELVDVAKDMDRPDLIYNFLDLASHHSIWSSKLGAAFSLSSILQVNQKLSSHLGSILPKLYRYQFDTNKKIQDSMKKMWLNLVTHPREMINQHFDAIITDLLESMGNRQYRVRNSSCLALCELLHGRNMDQLDPYLEKLWVYTFRLLDDVNEHVRKSATQLAGALSHLSIRLCDTKFSNRASAQKALNIVLPVLLKEGVVAKAKEIQSVSIRAVLAIIKIGGANLRPHLATLIGTLLESMSNLEPQVFSYLQFHAQSMNMSEEQLERARLSVASGGVLADAVASCLLVVDEESVPSILAKITDIIHTGIGLPTLTAAAKFVVSLVNSKVALSMRDHINPLILQLMQGLSDQSPTLRKSYADALGYLCKIAKKKRVEKLITSLLEMYVSDKSSETSRLISGFALRSIVRQAPDMVRTNFMLELVPIAFLGSHDNTPGNTEIGKVWSETFEELIPGLDAGVVLYMKECSECCRKLLESSVYALRHIALLALKHLILASKLRFADELSTTLPLLLKILPGRLWTGKEVALDCLAFLSQECHTKMTASQARSVVKALAAEMDRNKTEYKREAIRCFGKSVTCFPYLNEKETILLAKPFFQPILELTADSTKGDEKKDGATPATATTTSSSSSSSSSADEPKAGPDNLLVTYTYAALAEMLPSPQSAVTELHILRMNTDATAIADVNELDWYTLQSNHAAWILDSLLSGLEKGFSWTIRVAILLALKRFFENIYTGDELAPTTAGSVVPKRAFGPSLVRVEYLGQVVASLLKSTGLGEPKYPLVKARAMELLQTISERPTGQMQHSAIWSALLDPANLAIARELNAKLIAMRSDTEASVLRLGPPIQTKLAAAIENKP